LHVAAEKNKRDVVEHLLVHGAYGNIRNNKQWAPIHVATMLNHSEIIEVEPLCYEFSILAYRVFPNSRGVPLYLVLRFSFYEWIYVVHIREYLVRATGIIRKVTMN
jgi:hypothetical protein